MARKNDLRQQREGTVINVTSKKQETLLIRALQTVVASLKDEFLIRLKWRQEWLLSDVIAQVSRDFPDVTFAEPLPRSAMKPDGGILSIVDGEGTHHVILIVEVKNQGTNDLRLAEGKSRQAMGNAIERLGKNVIGFRTAMLRESITPFVCFGYGCDFAEGSSIRDRVMTIAMFGQLNETRPLSPPVWEGSRPSTDENDNYIHVSVTPSVYGE
ncbi:MAG: EcoRI family type II restriction endonuclease [Acidimicrobiales bacterium]